jgi:hypothetical protein
VSNRFEGLNLVDLIDLLHEIVMPEPVSWLPQTPGWWTLGGWLLAIVAIGVAHWIRHRRRNRYRRQAEAELDAIAARLPSEPTVAAMEIAELVKRTALAAYPRERVASLHGHDWAEFLRDSTDNDRTVADGAERLANAAYRPDSVAEELVEPARRWIREHRA